MTSNNQKLMMLISSVLNIDENSINNDTSPENTESWDSFNALVMVSELESEFEVQFSIDEVYSVSKVEDIKNAGGIAIVSATPQNTKQFAPIAKDAGVDIFVVQSTVTTANHVSRSLNGLKLK